MHSKLVYYLFYDRIVRKNEKRGTHHPRHPLGEFIFSCFFFFSFCFSRCQYLIVTNCFRPDYHTGSASSASTTILTPRSGPPSRLPPLPPISSDKVLLLAFPEFAYVRALFEAVAYVLRLIILDFRCRLDPTSTMYSTCYLFLFVYLSASTISTCSTFLILACTSSLHLTSSSRLCGNPCHPHDDSRGHLFAYLPLTSHKKILFLFFPFISRLCVFDNANSCGRQFVRGIADLYSPLL